MSDGVLGGRSAQGGDCEASAAGSMPLDSVRAPREPGRDIVPQRDESIAEPRCLILGRFESEAVGCGADETLHGEHAHNARLNA
jgi:hypothetical protein